LETQRTTFLAKAQRSPRVEVLGALCPLLSVLHSLRPWRLGESRFWLRPKAALGSSCPSWFRFLTYPLHCKGAFCPGESTWNLWFPRRTNKFFVVRTIERSAAKWKPLGQIGRAFPSRLSRASTHRLLSTVLPDVCLVPASQVAPARLHLRLARWPGRPPYPGRRSGACCPRPARS